MATENINIQLLLDTNKSAKNLGELKKSLADLKKGLNSTEINSKSFFELADAIDESTEKIRTFRNGLDNIKQFESIGGILANSFSLATSSMAAFGAESEDTQKALLKVQAAMGIANSISGLADMLGKARAAGLAFNATLLANPFVIVGVAVTALVLTFNNLTDSTTTSKEELEKYNETLGFTKNELDAIFKEYEGKEIKPLTAESFRFDKEELKAYNDELLKIIILREKELLIAKERRENDKLVFAAIKNQVEFENSVVLEKQSDAIKLREAEIALIKAKGASAEEVLRKEIDLENLKQSQAKENLNIYNSEQQLANLIITSNNIIVTKQTEIADIQERLTNAKVSGNQFDIKNETANLANANRRLEIAKQEIDLIKPKYEFVVTEQNKLNDSLSKEEQLRAQLNKAIDDAAAKSAEAAEKAALELAFRNRIKQEIIEFDPNGENSNLLDEETKLINANKLAIDELIKSKKGIDAIYQQEIYSLGNRIMLYTKEIDSLEKKNKLTDEEKAKLEQLKNTLKQLNEQKTEFANKLENDNTFLEKLAEVDKYLNAILSTTNNISNAITAGISQAVDNNIAQFERERDAAVLLLEDRYNQNLEADGEYAAKKEEIEREFNKKRQKELKKLFIANKAASIIQATIQGALSVTQALASLPPPLSFVFAALNGAAAAAQIGIISASKPPQEFAKGGIFKDQFADGGMIKGPGSGTSDSINARLSNGESIINARSTAMFNPILSAINQIGGGVAFTPESKISTNPTGIKENKTENQTQALNISVSVSEAEVTKVQNKVTRIQERNRVF